VSEPSRCDLSGVHGSGPPGEDDATGLRGFGRDLRLAAQADIVSNVIDIGAAVLAVLVVRRPTRLVREAPVVS
jgi:hypothetical protein